MHHMWLIIIKNETHKLVGLIELKKSPNCIGHYIAYIFHANKWLKKDDFANGIPELTVLPKTLRVTAIFSALINNH